MTLPEKETLLWGIRKGCEPWQEELLTNRAERVEDTKKWALANGFDRFRVSILDLSTPPNFGKTVRTK